MPERKRREGYGPYVKWQEASEETKAELWRFWLCVGGLLVAIGYVSDWLS